MKRFPSLFSFNLQPAYCAKRQCRQTRAGRTTAARAGCSPGARARPHRHRGSTAAFGGRPCASASGRMRRRATRHPRPAAAARRRRGGGGGGFRLFGAAGSTSPAGRRARQAAAWASWSSALIVAFRLLGGRGQRNDGSSGLQLLPERSDRPGPVGAAGTARRNRSSAATPAPRPTRTPRPTAAAGRAGDGGAGR